MIGFAKVTRDITDRKLSEENLRKSEAQPRLLVQGVADYAIYMLDPEGRVTNWNAGAQCIKGYSPAEILGHHFSSFYTEEDQAGGEPDKALARARAEGRFDKEGWRVRKDGTRFWASVVIDAIHEGNRQGHGSRAGDGPRDGRAIGRTALFEEQEESRHGCGDLVARRLGGPVPSNRPVSRDRADTRLSAGSLDEEDSRGTGLRSSPSIPQAVHHVVCSRIPSVALQMLADLLRRVTH